MHTFMIFNISIVVRTASSIEFVFNPWAGDSQTGIESTCAPELFDGQTMCICVDGKTWIQMILWAGRNEWRVWVTCNECWVCVTFQACSGHKRGAIISSAAFLLRLHRAIALGKTTLRWATSLAMRVGIPIILIPVTNARYQSHKNNSLNDWQRIVLLKNNKQPRTQHKTDLRVHHTTRVCPTGNSSAQPNLGIAAVAGERIKRNEDNKQ